MTTINNIEDLIRLLDENPEWLEAVRARILTRELIDLPQTMAQFIEVTNQRFDELDQRFDELDQRIGVVESETKSIRAEMEQGFASVRRDLGILKGGHDRASAIREATAITDGLGLNRIRNLEYDDLRNISISANIQDIPINELRSFRLADLVMEATDQTGEGCYVVVEISYTANGRDTRRAIRNAAFLTRFTGRPSHAVIAGIDRDDRIDRAIESGDVSWHQLHLDDLEIE